MNKESFLRLATAAALASSGASGLPPGITVAHAALESAWGRSRLAREACNYFGIKARGGGDFITLPTTEFVDGKLVRCTARFARYTSLEDCFAARDHLILTLACYAPARACAADPEAFVRALARRWATDPHYADKLLRVYRANRLDALDAPVSPQQSALSP